MSRATRLAGVSFACFLLTACGDKLPSEYHGKWHCPVSGGTYEISGSSVTYTTSFRGSGDFRSSIAEVKDYDGGKYVSLPNAPGVSITLKRIGNQMQIDGVACNAR
jgi:hypothetical protein